MPTMLAPSRAVRTETLRIVPDQTLRDLEALPEGTLAQLIDGEIITSPAPNLQHQRLVLVLASRLMGFVAEGDLGSVFVAPVDVRLRASQSVQPDVVFVARERSSLLGGQAIEGAPDLVVEVLSPSTAYYDLTKKRDLYASAGVLEYWIVDPERRTVEVLALHDGVYGRSAFSEGEGSVGSALLHGFSVDVAALFAR